MEVLVSTALPIVEGEERAEGEGGTGMGTGGLLVTGAVMIDLIMENARRAKALPPPPPAPAPAPPVLPLTRPVAGVIPPEGRGEAEEEESVPSFGGVMRESVEGEEEAVDVVVVAVVTAGESMSMGSSSSTTLRNALLPFSADGTVLATVARALVAAADVCVG